MQTVALVPIAVAGILAYFTYTEGTLAFQSTAEPEEITLKDLLARGPDGNANIILTDFVLCANFVYQPVSDKDQRWHKVWVPVVTPDDVDPAGQGRPKPNKVNALFYSTEIRTAGARSCPFCA